MRTIANLTPSLRLRAVGLAICGLTAAAAPAADDLRSRYTKFEYKIPMRDGKTLFTAAYVPKDRSKRYPILMTRTPYGLKPYGVDNYPKRLGPSPRFEEQGYIFVGQDVRGRWMSEGEFVDMRPIRPHAGEPAAVDESTDAFDTISWLLAHVENHNGSVGIWGISYPGFYAASALVDAHPALKAASPQAPVTDWFAGDDWHHNGAFFLPHAFLFLADFGRPRPGPTRSFDPTFSQGTPDGYQYFLDMGPLANADRRHFRGGIAFWNELMQHGTYDEFWKARNLRPHLKGVRAAVLTVGGWFDAENLFGALETYRAIESTSPAATNLLVMGPWSHGAWADSPGRSLGPVPFHSDTSAHFNEKVLLPFFERHLKGGEAAKLAEATVFATGINEWREYPAWPPAEARPQALYFREGGRLSFEPPANEAARSHTTFVSDPAKPVPFLADIAKDMKKEYMVADQRFASRRTDVLTFETGPLESEVCVVGPIQASLHVATSGTDADWVVKLIDAYPDDFPNPDPNPADVRMGGYQQLVRGDVVRGKFRRSLEKPEPFTPDRPTLVSFRLQDIHHTFRAGHRIMVHVQGTWFPLVDRNPQQFVDIYRAKETDFQTATHRVYHGPGLETRLDVLLLAPRDCPLPPLPDRATSR